MDVFAKFYNPGIGFLLTLFFGFWLARLGKPYRGLLFNIHKLIALGAVILTGIPTYNLLKGSQIQELLILSMIVAILGMVALFASGAFLSIGNLDYRMMKIVHYAGLILAGLGIIFTIYLLSGRMP